MLFALNSRLNHLRWYRWLRSIWNWLSEGKIVFMGIFVISAILLLGMFAWSSEASIRVAGLALQLIGMIFAVRGLLAVREHFGQPRLRNLFVQWMKRFPKWKSRVTSDLSMVSSIESTMNFTAEIWMPDNPDSSMEKRVEAVISNLERIREMQTNQSQILQDLKTSQDEHAELVAKQTKKLEESLRSDLETLHTGDILTSLVGLFLLTVGIFLSTLAPELAMFVYGA
jgi:hypothetical protein